MNKSYHLTLKVFQAVVLLMFNQSRYAQDDATIRVIDISNETNMSVENFKQGMLKLCEPGKNFLNKSNPKKPTFNDNDTISLNLQFDSRSVRCNFIPSKTKKKVTLEPTADEVTMQKRIRKERAFVIQSKIVKIMKAHKSSTVQDLILQVIQHITMFKADPPMIKDQIEALISKNYMARDNENAKILIYVP